MTLVCLLMHKLIVLLCSWQLYNNRPPIATAKRNITFLGDVLYITKNAWQGRECLLTLSQP